MNISKNLQDAALTLLKRNIKMKKGERVLVITDRKDCKIFTSICAAVEKLGGILLEAYITNEREHSSPLPQLKELLRQADVIIAPTDKSITHSPEVREARLKYGARLISMPGITEELFIKGVDVDPGEIKKINNRLRKKLENAKNITVISPSGTLLKIKLDKEKFEFNDNGDCSKPSLVSNLPYGEVYVFFKKAEGRIVIDRWRNEINQQKKAVLEIKNGKIVNFNSAAKPYVSHQLSAGECGLQIVEFGIGTNPSHKKPIGIVLYDEKVYGSVHFAFGGGGEIRKCGIHEDFVVLNPTVVVDGEELIKKGKFL